MSKPGIIYRLNWQSFHESTDLQCYIDISDNDNLIPDDEDEQIIDVTPAGEPARISVIDNDENPFTPILAQQLTINFISTTQVNMSTFISGSDQRFSVHYYLGTNTQTLFKGFLVSDDNSVSEDFLYPPNIVTLTANDGLPLLKDIPLVDFNGDNPVDWHSIIDYLAFCLNKTGLSLSIMASFNIKLVGMNDDISIPNSTNEHLFSKVYLSAKTFEDEIGISINCYEAISRILGFEARLFQYRGTWWILRVDEVEDATRGVYVTEFDSTGSFVGNLGEFDFVKQIGTSNDIFFSEASTKVTATRANKSVRLNYNFEFPDELPCNKDFDRGDYISDISATQKKYAADCWTLYQNRPLVPSLNSTAFVVRTFADGYETERYGVIDTATASIEQLWASSWIYVNAKDLFDLSVQVKHNGQIDTGSGSVRGSYMQVHLYADDGTFYNLNGGRADTGVIPVWRQCTSSFNTNQSYFGVTYDAGDDDTEWKTVTFENGPCPPVPKAGKMRIVLAATYKVDQFQTIFSPVSFTLKPFINGSNAKYEGQYHTTNQSGNFKKKLEDDVYISDSPHKEIKGSLFVIDSYRTVVNAAMTFATSTPGSITIPGNYVENFYEGMLVVISATVSNNMTTRVVSVSYSIIASSTVVVLEDATVVEIGVTALIQTPVFELAGLFYNAAVFPGGPPSSDYHHRYGKIQLFDVWNQYNRDMRVFQATCQGIDLDKTKTISGDSLPYPAHLINKWKLNDPTEHTNNKFFIALHFDQDHNTQEWWGSLRECVDTTINKDYSNHEFKYIT